MIVCGALILLETCLWFVNKRKSIEGKYLKIILNIGSVEIFHNTHKHLINKILQGRLSLINVRESGFRKGVH